MRLKSYVNEKVKALGRVKDVIEKTIVPLGKWLERNEFQVKSKEFLSTLNKIYNRHNIYFYPEKRDKMGLNTFIKDMNLVRSEDGFHIEVNVYDDVDKYLRTLNKSNFYSAQTNQFLMNLIEGLIHEFNHWEQDLKARGKSFAQGQGTSELDTTDYFKDKSEIDSHALQAVVHMMRYGKPSYMFQQYVEGDFNDNDKTFKRFMKRYKKYGKLLKKSEVMRTLLT
jgi:hypothetical protein